MVRDRGRTSQKQTTNEHRCLPSNASPRKPIRTPPFDRPTGSRAAPKQSELFRGVLDLKEHALRYAIAPEKILTGTVAFRAPHTAEPLRLYNTTCNRHQRTLLGGRSDFTAGSSAVLVSSRFRFGRCSRVFGFMLFSLWFLPPRSGSCNRNDSNKEPKTRMQGTKRNQDETKTGRTI